MSPNTLLAVTFGVNAITILLLTFHMFWVQGRIEKHLRMTIDLARAVATDKAHAECDQLGRDVAFQLAGLKFVLAELRSHVETTAALVEEIGGIDGSANGDHTADLLAKGM